VEQPRLQNILVVRTDRIGDVILTLPTVEALKANFPDARVSMLVSSYTAGLVEGIANTIIYDREGKKRPFFEILKDLRTVRFDAAIIAYPRFRIALLLLLARIPTRIGTGYRWYSFLFNKRVYEHRKTAEKHEAEYNLSLINVLGCTLPSKPEVYIEINEKDRKAAKELWRSIGIPGDGNLIILHPGSGGSARDWKPERFANLASELIKEGYHIVITGSARETDLVNRITSEAGEGAKSFISSLSLREFGAFIQTAELFISNSTGPLHIAAAVGIPVIGFYPPVRVMSPKRWGPLTEKKVIFVPDSGKCPRCKGGECRGNDCMDQIDVAQVLTGAKKLLTK
jgi:lipopolysaccharide heptosyltransferase II